MHIGAPRRIGKALVDDITQPGSNPVAVPGQTGQLLLPQLICIEAHFLRGAGQLRGIAQAGSSSLLPPLPVIPYYLAIDTILNYSLITPRRLRREIPTSTRTAICLGKRTYTLSVGVNFGNSYGILIL